jgi:hypothetical protein
MRLEAESIQSLLNIIQVWRGIEGGILVKE